MNGKKILKFMRISQKGQVLLLGLLVAVAILAIGLTEVVPFYATILQRRAEDETKYSLEQLRRSVILGLGETMEAFERKDENVALFNKTINEEIDKLVRTGKLRRAYKRIDNEELAFDISRNLVPSSSFEYKVSPKGLPWQIDKHADYYSADYRQTHKFIDEEAVRTLEDPEAQNWSGQLTPNSTKHKLYEGQKDRFGRKALSIWNPRKE